MPQKLIDCTGQPKTTFDITNKNGTLTEELSHDVTRSFEDAATLSLFSLHLLCHELQYICICQKNESKSQNKINSTNSYKCNVVLGCTDTTNISYSEKKLVIYVSDDKKSRFFSNNANFSNAICCCRNHLDVSIALLN